MMITHLGPFSPVLLEADKRCIPECVPDISSWRFRFPATVVCSSETKLEGSSSSPWLHLKTFPLPPTQEVMRPLFPERPPRHEVVKPQLQPLGNFQCLGCQDASLLQPHSKLNAGTDRANLDLAAIKSLSLATVLSDLPNLV